MKESSELIKSRKLKQFFIKQIILFVMDSDVLLLECELEPQQEAKVPLELKHVQNYSSIK